MRGITTGLESIYLGRLRASAVIALGERGEVDAVGTLKEILDDPDPYASVPRNFAAVALGQIGDPAGLPGLVRLVAGRQGDRRVGDATVRDDDPARGFAAIGLGLYARPWETEQGVQDRQGLAGVLDTLRDRLLDDSETPELRQACAVALGLSGRTSALPGLVKATQGLRLREDAATAGAVLMARAMLGDRGVGAPVQALLDERPHRDAITNSIARRDAVLALGLTGTREVIPQLVVAWDIEDYYINHEVIYAIGLHGAVGLAETLIEHMEDAESRWERAFMAEAIGVLFAPPGPSGLARDLIARDFTMMDGLLEDSRARSNSFLYRELIPQFEEKWY